MKSVKQFIKIKTEQAKKRGLEWQITEEQYKELRSQKYCFYTGIELAYVQNSTQLSNSWTLDRIDNSRGYTIDNVVVCSYAANLIKEALCAESLKKFDPEMVNKVKNKLNFQSPITIKSKFQRIIEILFS